MTEPKLKPCPFCGRDAQISDGGHTGTNYAVRCIAGRADNDFVCPAMDGIVCKTKKEAIKAWNRRAEPCQEQ